MIKIEGIDRLLEKLPLFSGLGWIFIANRDDKDTVASIMSATFFIAEVRDERNDMIDTHHTFLEFDIFTGVVELEGKAGRTSPEDIAAGCLYYLEMDTSRD